MPSFAGQQDTVLNVRGAAELIAAVQRTAAALVTETGSIVAHGPTVAANTASRQSSASPMPTEQIRTGQRITVDGAAGTVTLDAPG